MLPQQGDRVCRGYDIWTDHQPQTVKAGERCPFCRPSIVAPAKTGEQS